MTKRRGLNSSKSKRRTMANLTPPYPYFGGKRAVADTIWSWLGDVDRYIEPFFGAGAVWLARPSAPRRECVNDLNSMIANFWRSTKYEPEVVVEHCDWPTNETDLHARHMWLTGLGSLEATKHMAEFRRRMYDDPDYYDPKIAGWWVWGICNWVGNAWCSKGDNGVVVPNRRPACDISRNTLKGQVHKARPEASRRGVVSPPDKRRSSGGVENRRPDKAALGVNKRGGQEARLSLGACDRHTAKLMSWFKQLQDRLRYTHVYCGDWKRTCCSPSITHLGVESCGVFLDPPYSEESGRDKELYVMEDLQVAHEVREWCLEHGDNPKMRIVLAGYEGEGHEELEDNGWSVESWTTGGGMGNIGEGRGKENATKERLWMSPHCLRQRGQLFMSGKAK